MEYTREQFIEDVKAEAMALRENATEDERHKLSFRTLRPRDYDSCIYGQMTGNCVSDRASLLIFKCCTRYFDMPQDESGFYVDSFDKIKKYANGKKVKGVHSGRQLKETRIGDISHFSSIETYILWPQAKRKNLIAYLRGETDTLDL